MFGFLKRTEGIAVRHQGGDLTYGGLNALLGLLGRHLRSLKLAPGDRVATVFPNSLELLLCYYACLLEGLIIVPINERLTDKEIKPLLRHSQPKVLLTTPESSGKLAALNADEPIPLATLGDGHGWIEENPDEKDSSQPPPKATGALNPWPEDQPGILFYTSGSTGLPKGALYTHRTLIDNGRVYGNALDVSAGDHSVLCHCMSSNFVFSQLTVPFLDRGGTVEIVDFGSVEQTLRAIERGATFLSLIPWFGFKLIEHGRERARTPNAIRVSEVGGDRVPMNYFRDFKEVFGILPREHLGMTEANTYCVNPAVEDEIRLGSVGKPMAEVRVEIRDPALRSLPIGEEGEIWVNTPGRMEAYWRDPEKTRAILVDGWLATGDVGYMDEDGFLWLSGRLKHIIICDGDNIHPEEVEREIAEHPLVERACIFGLPHERRGATVAAAVVLRSPAVKLHLAELASFLARRLTEVKIPKTLLVLDDFPETPAGKLDREAMVKMLRK